jgi:3-deoxy-7-phosphoheptulonate synthase
MSAYEHLQSQHLPPKIIVDCSHDNSKKDLDKQEKIFKELVYKKLSGELPIIGVMLESFLKEGSQKISCSIDPFVSITDPCLSWETTRSLVLWSSALFEREKIFV